jgi:hypothetical protein
VVVLAIPVLYHEPGSEPTPIQERLAVCVVAVVVAVVVDVVAAVVVDVAVVVAAAAVSATPDLVAAVPVRQKGAEADPLWAGSSMVVPDLEVVLAVPLLQAPFPVVAVREVRQVLVVVAFRLGTTWEGVLRGWAAFEEAARREPLVTPRTQRRRLAG